MLSPCDSGFCQATLVLLARHRKKCSMISSDHVWHSVSSFGIPSFHCISLHSIAPCGSTRFFEVLCKPWSLQPCFFNFAHQPVKPRRVDPIKNAWSKLQGQWQTGLHKWIAHSKSRGILQVSLQNTKNAKKRKSYEILWNLMKSYEILWILYKCGNLYIYILYNGNYRLELVGSCRFHNQCNSLQSCESSWSAYSILGPQTLLEVFA